jgi:hypothetical protein
LLIVDGNFASSTKENDMKNVKTVLALVSALSTLVWWGPSAGSQEKAGPAAAQVHVVITDAALRTDSELPPLQKEDLTLKQGKNTLDITQLIHADGNNAALQLFILIDDTLDQQAVGNNLNDIKEFISAQPSTTVVGVGYMSNATIQLVQNFTNDHDLAAKAIRLPLGRLSTQDSPYLSLISLIKSWEQQKVRREIVMVSDGIDRLRGERPEGATAGAPLAGGPRAGGPFPSSPVYHSMPMISVDADRASEAAQRYNAIVWPIFSPGVGRMGRSSWGEQLGLSGLTKIADESGGECFSLGTSMAVSFKPYLDKVQKYLNNQYYLVFNVDQGKRDSLVRVNIRRVEGKNSEIFAPDNVWVPGIPKAEKSKGK